MGSGIGGVRRGVGRGVYSRAEGVRGRVYIRLVFSLWEGGRREGKEGKEGKGKEGIGKFII